MGILTRSFVTTSAARRKATQQRTTEGVVRGEVRARARDEGLAEGARRERERWEWQSRPLESGEEWLPWREELFRQNKPLLRLLLVPAPLSVDFEQAMRAQRMSTSCGVQNFVADPQVWRAPTGQLIRWFNWRPEGFEALSLREYERKQLIERHKEWEARQAKRGASR